MRITYNWEYEKRLKVCCIGCGGHSYRNVYPTFQYAPVELAAFCDVREEAAREFARIFAAPRHYGDHREMLEKEQPDAVFIITNYDEQGDPRYPGLAIDCMRAGAHTWIEKPPAGSSEAVQEMMAVSRETGRQVGVGFKKMFFPANVKAYEISRSADFGEITSITARYPQSLPAQVDRDDKHKMIGFLDHVMHPYSLLRLLGGPVDSIFYRRNDRVGSTVTAIQFISGAIGSLHLSAGQSGQCPLERSEVVGEGTTVVVENNVRVTYYRRGGAIGGYGRAGSYYDDQGDPALVWEPEFSLGQLYNKGLFLLGYAPEVIDFCEHVLAEKPLEKGNLGDALEILRIYEAYRQPEGRVIEIARD